MVFSSKSCSTPGCKLSGIVSAVDDANEGRIYLCEVCLLNRNKIKKETNTQSNEVNIKKFLNVYFD